MILYFYENISWCLFKKDKCLPQWTWAKKKCNNINSLVPIMEFLNFKGTHAQCCLRHQSMLNWSWVVIFSLFMLLTMKSKWFSAFIRCCRCINSVGIRKRATSILQVLKDLPVHKNTNLMIPYGKHQAEDRYFQQNLTQAGAAISRDRVVGEVKEEREKRSTQRQDTNYGREQT